jgi:hypothetical protein
MNSGVILDHETRNFGKESYQIKWPLSLQAQDAKTKEPVTQSQLHLTEGEINNGAEKLLLTACFLRLVLQNPTEICTEIRIYFVMWSIDSYLI